MPVKLRLISKGEGQLVGCTLVPVKLRLVSSCGARIFRKRALSAANSLSWVVRKAAKSACKSTSARVRVRVRVRVRIRVRVKVKEGREERLQVDEREEDVRVPIHSRRL